jgi:rubrerythrin
MNPTEKLNFRKFFTEKETIPEYDILLKNVTIYDLAKAFRRIIEGLKKNLYMKLKK